MIFNAFDSCPFDQVKVVILGHVSLECNSKECLENEIINKLDGYNIIIANQYEATDMIEV